MLLSHFPEPLQARITRNYIEGGSWRIPSPNPPFIEGIKIGDWITADAAEWWLVREIVPPIPDNNDGLGNYYLCVARSDVEITIPIPQAGVMGFLNMNGNPSNFTPPTPVPLSKTKDY